MISRPFDVLVIDDEEYVRHKLMTKLEESGNWNIVGETDNVKEALRLITQADNIDAVFLDIKIREGTAFDILDQLKIIGFDIPPIILNTGFTQWEYAQKVVNEYKEIVIKLLEKPFWENWAMKELDIISKLAKRKNSEFYIDEAILKLRYQSKTNFISLKDIIFIEIESKGQAGCKIITYDNCYFINKTLVRLKTHFPENFVQISRHAIINKYYLESYDHSENTLRLRSVYDRVFHVGRSFLKNIV